MIESIIMAMIYVCLIVLAVYIVVWVITELGVPVPAQVMKIVWIIVALICILLIVRVLLPGIKLASLPLPFLLS